MEDRHGRVIDYLRVSVTDRCGLRCQYCLPGGSGSPVSVGQAPLSDEETVRLARILRGLGLRRIRLTGGEPLGRPGLPSLVSRLAGLGLEDLALTTNGQRLAALARPLAGAGLRRVNVSLDSLDAGRYRAITRGGRIEPVLAGIQAALEAGLSPVKINVVVARGLNDDRIPEFVALARNRPLHVRFIELMPLGDAGFYSEDRRVPREEMFRLCGPLSPALPGNIPDGNGPAEVYRSAGMMGSVGFIAALSRPFCASCNRMRLSSRGLLQACLDSEDGVDLAGPLRAGASERTIAALAEACLRGKPAAHAMCGDGSGALARRMSAIGG